MWWVVTSITIHALLNIFHHWPITHTKFMLYPWDLSSRNRVQYIQKLSCKYYEYESLAWQWSNSSSHHESLTLLEFEIWYQWWNIKLIIYDVLKSWVQVRFEGFWGKVNWSYMLMKEWRQWLVAITFATKYINKW